MVLQLVARPDGVGAVGSAQGATSGAASSTSGSAAAHRSGAASHHPAAASRSTATSAFAAAPPFRFLLFNVQFDAAVSVGKSDGLQQIKGNNNEKKAA